MNTALIFCFFCIKAKEREKIIEEILEEVNEGTMPLSLYTLVHPGAKLDPLKVKTIGDWINKKGGMGKTLRQEKERSNDN
mgnify:CR=1 FL=1